MKGLIIIARKNDQLRRKEIVYTAEEWKQIEKKAEKCHLKTSTFIRAMSLDGAVTVVDLKEACPSPEWYAYHIEQCESGCQESERDQQHLCRRC